MTLVQRPTPVPTHRREPMAGVVTGAEEGPTCTCADPELIKLLNLMNRGVSQVEASRMLWGDPSTPDLVQEPPAERVEVSFSNTFLSRWWRG